MSQSNSTPLIELTNLNKILGTPSTQIVLQLLVCWDELAVKELIEKSKFSESQIHTTLQNLEKEGLVQKKSRGIYRLTESKFILSLKEAYLVKLEQLIGKQLYSLAEKIDILSLEELHRIWNELVELWNPILKKYFVIKASQIAGHIIDRETGH